MTRTLEEGMKNLGWEFFQCGPNEGKWFLFQGDKCVAVEGTSIWHQHLGIVKEWRRTTASIQPIVEEHGTWRRWLKQFLTLGRS